MALNTLEHGNITQINWMFERLVWPVASLAFAIGKTSQIDGVLKGTQLHRGSRIGRVVDHCMTDVTIVSHHLSAVADVFIVVAAKTSGKIKMSNIIGMCFPICLHLWEKIGPKDALDLARCGLYCIALAAINLRIVLRIELIESSSNRTHTLIFGFVRVIQQGDRFW